MLLFIERKQKFSVNLYGKATYCLTFSLFQACPQVEKDFLNVHIVPHSHDGKKLFTIFGRENSESHT